MNTRVALDEKRRRLQQKTAMGSVAISVSAEFGRWGDSISSKQRAALFGSAS